MAVNTIEFAPPPANVAAIPHDYVARLRVEQYHEMIQAGILQSGDPIELLEGWLVYKMTKKPPHQVSTGLTRNTLNGTVPKGWYIDTQVAITLQDSEPEPDVAIIRGQLEDYLTHHPTAKDVALVIEISDATLQRDQTFKQRVYASAKIPQYWIVNLVEGQIEVLSEPSGVGEDAKYLQQKIFRGADSIPVIVDNKTVGSVIASHLFRR